MSNVFAGAYAGRRVLVTGHTGFKGSWFALWLKQLGADVAGYSIGLPTDPANFSILGLDRHVRHYLGDIRDRGALAAAIDEYRPDIIFHLAAQALVQKSYVDPVTTFETNTMGMVNVLECIRTRPWIKAAVLITSDKAYRNDEWCWGYRETDALGGHDPYSGSKSCAELVAHSYFHSFLRNCPTQVATTRAGNVIGGGDWAEGRIVPDSIKAWAQGEAVTLRSPNATRPWQHVLEPLSGYLWLGARLLAGQDGLNGEAFNFGPDANVNQTVAQLLDAMSARWPGVRWQAQEGIPTGGREANLLKLSCDKALFHLGWHAVLRYDETVAMTIDWYRNWHEGRIDMYEYECEQIAEYTRLAAERRLSWTHRP
jgi:CDP-glucose 4,6-dehydratase